MGVPGTNKLYRYTTIGKRGENYQEFLTKGDQDFAAQTRYTTMVSLRKTKVYTTGVAVRLRIKEKRGGVIVVDMSVG